MEKIENKTVYRCEKCGALFSNEKCCLTHEENCDGERMGKLAAKELTDLMREIYFERDIDIRTRRGMRVVEAQYDSDNKCIVLVTY